MTQSTLAASSSNPTAAQQWVVEPPPQQQQQDASLSSSSSSSSGVSSSNATDTTTAATTTATATTTKSASNKTPRCHMCNKKVGLMGFSCKCELVPGAVFCAAHRHAEAHGCTYDYKMAQQKCLNAKNPLVQASKVLKL